MPILEALFGAFLLFYGRRLYWAFVAITGFFVGAQLAEVALADQSQVLRVLVAIGAGLFGALLAILVQRVGFALGGLFAGGYLALSLASAVGSSDNYLLWLGIGGVIGAVVAVVLMDWAIIVLSSLVGAAAMVVLFDLTPLMTAILLVVLAAVGITVQGNRLRPRTASHENRS